MNEDLKISYNLTQLTRAKVLEPVLEALPSYFR